MPQPDGQPKYNDLIDIIIQSSQKTIDVQQKDGSITKEQIIDDDTVWFKTGSVNANTYGRFAFELKEWERLALIVENNMSHPRALQLGHEVMEIGISYRRSIDAKSSESQRNAQNIIDETAEAPSRGERVRFTRNRAPPSQVIEGEPHPGTMADRAPKESYRDIMQATAAPTAPRNRKRGGAYSGSPYVFPMSSGQSLPAARPSSSRDPAPNRRNKGPPKKKDDDKSSK